MYSWMLVDGYAKKNPTAMIGQDSGMPEAAVVSNKTDGFCWLHYSPLKIVRWLVWELQVDRCSQMMR